MTNILELLKNEKVEWKKLGEVANIQRGRVYRKSILKNIEGSFRYIHLRLKMMEL